MAKIEKYLREISKSTQAVAATNVAKIVGPSVNSLLSNNTSTPDTSFQSVEAVEIEDDGVLLSTMDEHTDDNPQSMSHTSDQKPQLEKQKPKKQISFPYSKELMSPGQLTSIFLKSKTERNFAALLVRKLFDVETLLKSNVSGRGKEQLDPDVIRYVKAKAFEFYECPEPDVQREWAKCVISIDEKSRSLKKQKSYKENQSLDVIDDKVKALSKLKVLEENNSVDITASTIDERICALLELKKLKEKQ